MNLVCRLHNFHSATATTGESRRDAAMLGDEWLDAAGFPRAVFAAQAFRPLDDGRYEGDDAYLTLREPAGRTFLRDELWVYCAHCSVNNEIQPVEWGGTPTSIEVPPEAPGERCVHHLYKDVADVVRVIERAGVAKRVARLEPMIVVKG